MKPRTKAGRSAFRSRFAYYRKKSGFDLIEISRRAEVPYQWLYWIATKGIEWPQKRSIERIERVAKVLDIAPIRLWQLPDPPEELDDVYKATANAMTWLVGIEGSVVEEMPQEQVMHVLEHLKTIERITKDLKKTLNIYLEFGEWNSAVEANRAADRDKQILREIEFDIPDPKEALKAAIEKRRAKKAK